MNILQEMLLIEEPSIFRLYKEMTSIATYFIAPVFTIALILEYFGELDFGGVVKKLLLITVFIGAFHQFHTKATNLALVNGSYTLKKVSPSNLFVKKWYHTKVKTTEKRDWNFIQSLVVPNLNDLLGTAFFLLAKVFIWLLKLIYSSVYHLTYVFSGVTAILYFLGWTKDALKGTVQASLWCMVMPFVIVAILALVGNSIDESALGSDLLVTKIDTIIWLFGVTLLLLISPLISYGLIKGDGIHSFGSKMGTMVVSSGMKAMTLSTVLGASLKKTSLGMGRAGSNSLLEPSIKELLRQGNSPDKNKMKLLDKKGGVKNPFKEGRSLDERLQAVGMTKDEAIKLTRSNSTQEQEQSYVSKSGRPKSNKSLPHKAQVEKSRPSLGQLTPFKTNDKSSQGYVRLQKQNFKFNQKYWDHVNPHKAEAIKNKYGIEGNKVDPQKVHRPVTPRRTRPERKEKINELR
ncbi:MAG TPA: hypothetical protein VKZ84_04030 [Bacteriovoracaceae bacterium]|nr:hypothetical protein [Bacteriovoracaceae bacterium]